MAAPRARRMNIPLRRVACACAVLCFVVLAHLSHLQAFRADTLREDARNPRHPYPPMRIGAP